MSSEHEDNTLANPEVVDKYRTAGQICNTAMQAVMSVLAPGNSVYNVCVVGDNAINEAASTVFNKKKGLLKGVAFPTTVSVNNCVGNYSPVEEEGSYVLQAGDVVKVDLGAHIDGCVSTVGHTFVVGTEPNAPITGRVADVICAAYYASECVHRLLRPGNTSEQIVDIIDRVCKVFNVNAVQGIVSHNMEQNVLDGSKTILIRKDKDTPQEVFEFETNEVYSVDVVLSTGQGIGKPGDEKTTVYRRRTDRAYNLKVQAARQTYGEIKAKFPYMAFNLRNFEDRNKARLGIKNCLQYELVADYPIVYEKEGEYVAQFKFTLLVLPSQSMKTTVDYPLPFVSSEFSIENDDEVQKVMAMSKEKKKRRRRKK